MRECVELVWGHVPHFTTPLPPKKVGLWCIFFALLAVNGPLLAKLKFRENTGCACQVQIQGGLLTSVENSQFFEKVTIIIILPFQGHRTVPSVPREGFFFHIFLSKYHTHRYFTFGILRMDLQSLTVIVQCFLLPGFPIFLQRV